MDSFGYSGGHNTFGLKGDKKDLLNPKKIIDNVKNKIKKKD